MKIYKVRNALIFAAVVPFAVGSYAAETAKDKGDDVTNHVEDSVKSTTHKVEDKACPMVNGKVQCAAKHAKHQVQDSADKAATKVKEVKHENE